MRKSATLKTFLAVAALSAASFLVCLLSPRPLWNVSSNHWLWLKSRVFSPGPDLDYVVLGSSHAWRGIVPGALSEGLDGASAWNLGRPWPGRDTDYFILKELVRRRRVKNVLVEFINKEKEEAHPYASQLVSPSDALAEAAFFLKTARLDDKDGTKERIGIIAGYLANFSVRLYLRLAGGRRELSRSYQEASDRENRYFLPEGELNKTRGPAKKQRVWKAVVTPGRPLPPDSRAGFYLGRIARLCAERGANLFFVALPIYMQPLPGKKRVAYLDRLGDVLLPDREAFADGAYWRDSTHLNKAGATLFTRNLVTLLEEGKTASPYAKSYWKKRRPRRPDGPGNARKIDTVPRLP